MEPDDLNRLADRVEALAAEARSGLRDLSEREWSHHHDNVGALGELIGQAKDLPRIHDRLDQVCTTAAELRGELRAVSEELRALRRTVDSLLLERSADSRRSVVGERSLAPSDAPPPEH
jgi:hypothetical protein